jgi:hypothetical protein
VDSFAQKLDALLQSCHPASENLPLLGSWDIGLSEKPLTGASIGIAGKLQDIPTLGGFILVDNKPMSPDLDHLVPESAKDVSHIATQATSGPLWDSSEPLWLHESEVGPLVNYPEGLASVLMEPEGYLAGCFLPRTLILTMTIIRRLFLIA